jgi:hypothetical protein
LLGLIVLIVRLAVPLFVRVTGWAGLVVFLSCVPKVRLFGARVTTGVPACAARLHKTMVKAVEIKLRAVAHRKTRRGPLRKNKDAVSEIHFWRIMSEILGIDGWGELYYLTQRLLNR